MEFTQRRIVVATLAAILLSRDSQENLPMTLTDGEDTKALNEFDQEAWPQLSAALRMANTLLDNAVIRHQK